MTYARREEILSKDCITTQELQELLGFTSLSQASEIITQIRLTVGDRLRVKGRIHVEDYLKFFEIKTDRYIKPLN